LSSPERQLLAANVRLGIALHRAEWPWRVWLLARLLPELVRTLVYVLIGLLVGGEPGMRFALVGCFVLIIASTTVGEVTDLPSIDDDEITDKGYINQRAGLERRSALVERLYADPPSEDVIILN